MFHLQAGPVQLPQPLLTGQRLQPLTILGDSTELDTVYRCLSCTGVPKLDAVSTCGLMEGWVEGINHFRLLAPALSVQPGMLVPFPCCQGTLQAHALLAEQQDSTSFSTELYPRQLQPSLLCCSIILPSQAQDFALVLAELCHISVRTFLQPDQVFLNGNPTTCFKKI